MNKLATGDRPLAPPVTIGNILTVLYRWDKIFSIKNKCNYLQVYFILVCE